MAFAPARVAPAVAQRLQIPVQVLLYVGLFIFAQYLVNRWQVPLPANLVGMVMLLLLIVCRVIPVSWVRAGARWLLAEMLLFFRPGGGRGGELRPAVDGRWLADISGDCLKHADGARRHRLGR
ncbi:LrgA family protein [Klebsiella pneumoniae]|uniref:LrgA family protein n=1 Tax=Klebsiella pneumoniae TaxID=573 RepID=A0A2X3CUA5_KLEPN|nr:LrgA family protein [Klebsiella pneumoniae]